ncbi:MAG TPA: SIR2 family protein [Polyangiaceae bacterium LLY-WYZ-15_(1-7)]|nr:SIR2 family protein [Polyangiaceae bacterium LLY-WYZ-15_(1-7)]HJL08672.1 SIR2 family protein [Polyangiaceae bacterium LLY-WYZ-15_(1-7)]HJL22179.1 SIR2 family protein [Polyangiaceae bacterium LLY-WYZ-15_(1-7)]HJL30000.1 SIR2 family protein [Polyangiaceae bacterium LLY-WYZ-15_(1-7)]HJL36982.1 SIR2 family protein [Polyangiaceae bacterium LLY-WYZ-15_(1-7)]
MPPAMTPLRLETAAARIRETRRSLDRRAASPYFFVCGAGISVPSVPLAWAIEQECRERAERLGLHSGTPPTDPAGGYSYWLEQAWPDPDQRRAFFRSKIVDQPLTDANLRLAHLLADGALTNLLITPNFDDFVSRGLHLFGHPHVVCDHPATTARIDLDAPDVQIIHVHGTYWFYDLVNTDSEIVERASGMRAGPGMGELLGDLLRARVPLVIGYSGWEGDVLMTALKARLAKGLKHQLYWFCYREDALDRLPAWLVDHPNVCFVVPEPGGALPADRVFEALLRVLKVDAPPLTRDPLGFFADQIRRHVPPRDPGAAPDLYYFDDVIARIERAASLSGEGARKVERDVEGVRDAVRRGRYGLAARRANAIGLRPMKKAQLGDLLDALWPAAARGGRDAAEDLRIYDAYLRVLDERPAAPVKSGRLASVLIGRVGALHARGHHRKAAAAVDDALGRLRDDRDKMPRAVHRLLRLKARALVADRRAAAALEIYDELEARFGKATGHRLRASVAGAQRERAAVLVELGREDDALDALDALVKRLEKAASARMRRELASALALRAELHGARGAKDAADEDAARAGAVLDATPAGGSTPPKAF